MNYIDGKPYADLHIYTTDVTSQINNLKAEVDQLDAQVTTLNSDLNISIGIIEQKNAEIVTLNKRIEELEGGNIYFRIRKYYYNNYV